MDVVDLTRRLIAFDTINPPGAEAEAMAFCAALLEAGGFTYRLVPQGPGRSNLVAEKGTGAGRALAFTGHLDTVPLGAAPWRHPPHAGVIEEGRLYGRGSTDMKGGVAAFIVAALGAPVPPATWNGRSCRRCASMRASAKTVVDQLLDDARTAPWIAETAFHAAALELAEAGISSLRGR